MADPTLVEIIVDDFPALVDDAAYLADEDATREAVRMARSAANGDLSVLHEEFPEYHVLEAVAAHEMGL